MKIIAIVLGVSILAIIGLNLSIGPSNLRTWTTGQGHTLEASQQNDGTSFKFNALRDIKPCTTDEVSDCFGGQQIQYARALLAFDDLQDIDLIKIIPTGDAEILGELHGLEFDFGPKNRILITVEPRLEAGETYDPVLSWLRAFEMGYFGGTIPAAAHYHLLSIPESQYTVERKELSLTPEQNVLALKTIIKRIQRLHKYPEFYNAFTNNREQEYINAIRSGDPKFKAKELR